MAIDGSRGRPPPAHREYRTQPFTPARWLPGPDFQTMGGKVLRQAPPLHVSRMRIRTPDDDFLDIDIGPDPGPGSPVAVILHGLEGSSRRPYVRLAMAELRARGVLPVGMNFRGCSGEMNRQPHFYHSGETGDLSLVLQVVRSRFPGRAVGALGFSLGGNVLLRYLGERGADAADSLDAAAAISVPYDLSAGADALEAGPVRRLYAGYFLRSLCGKARGKGARLAAIIDLERVIAARTIREFDESATAPLHGFSGAEEYYLTQSSGPVLSRIRVPTYLVHAWDDPFLPEAAVPVRAIDENPWLTAAISRRGGHVGFVEGAPWAPSFWVEAEVARYLAEVLVEKAALGERPEGLPQAGSGIEP